MSSLARHVLRVAGAVLGSGGSGVSSTELGPAFRELVA